MPQPDNDEQPFGDLARGLEDARRRALEELTSIMSGLVAEARVLTTAALRFDQASLAEATAALAVMAANPWFDLGRVSEIYGALRRAIIDRQPGRAGVPAPSPTGSWPTISTPPPAAQRSPSPTEIEVRWPSPG